MIAETTAIQTGGLWAVLLTAITAIGLILKGGYQFLRDLIKTRSEIVDGKATRNVALIEVSQEAAMTMLGKLNDDNNTQRERAGRAEAKVEQLEVAIDVLKAKNTELTDLVHSQGLQIAELLERIEGLEHQ